jgi:2-hydroxychromene-2-carboxylate isomerase
MAKIVDYYFTPISPWAYLGHQRFVAIVARHQADVNVRPVDMGKVFPASGGLPLARRAPQRQHYRLVELERWRRHLGVPINPQPRYAASGGDTACLWIIAALAAGSAAALAFAGAVMRARWVDERDIADPPTLAALAQSAGLSPEAIGGLAATPEVAAQYDAHTAQAIDAMVFGAPWYVYRGEPFWGQDRLDFLDCALAQ